MYDYIYANALKVKPTCPSLTMYPPQWTTGKEPAPYPAPPSVGHTGVHSVNPSTKHNWIHVTRFPAVFVSISQLFPGLYSGPILPREPPSGPPRCRRVGVAGDSQTSSLFVRAVASRAGWPAATFWVTGNARAHPVVRSCLLTLCPCAQWA